ARAGGQAEGEPREDGRAEEDEPRGHHPEARVRRVERERPPHQQRGTAEADRHEARGRGCQGRPPRRLRGRSYAARRHRVESVGVVVTGLPRPRRRGGRLHGSIDRSAGGGRTWQCRGTRAQLSRARKIYRHIATVSCTG
ncbi:Os04g0577337, partial [Oryza sativa Japonica Group]